jgi:hypothetical protein
MRQAQSLLDALGPAAESLREQARRLAEVVGSFRIREVSTG